MAETCFGSRRKGDATKGVHEQHLEPGMQSPRKSLLNLSVEPEPNGPLPSNTRATVYEMGLRDQGDFGLWHDVFVEQKLPWLQFLQSAVLHAGAFALVWMLSLAWLHQQSIKLQPAFDRSSLITYSPEEYLPPLDTGTPDPAPPEKGDPAFAKQPILSVPREADNRTQTIVVPPDIKLNRDVPLPNIVALSAPAPVVPLDATRSPLSRVAAPETAVVAPTPELDARNRPVRSALTSDVVAPAPTVTPTRTRGIAGPETAVVEPPPDVPRSATGRAGPLNIGPSTVIAPAPQLTVAEQHTISGRGTAGLPGAGLEPVAPPPSAAGLGGSSSAGRLVALGIHPVTPAGPIAAPGGNRRGTFAANPEGKPGASGTPGSRGGQSGTKASGNGNNGTNGNHGRGDNSLPGGLHVGAAESAAVTSSNGSGTNSDHGSAGNPSEMASATPPRVGGSVKPAAPVPGDKVTEVDRQVFGSKRFYSMIANMPNLNSSTGSWIIRFAELKANQQPGALTTPDAIQKSDPGYPTELQRANAQGTVTLYAVIHSDGTVGDIRVLSSPDERLDAFATSALARWKFRPATKDGKPVALEAVVKIPFRAKRSSF
jgi:TonB family protein